MHSASDLRRRIRSINGTATITKAMQMVAASKMRKAQEAALAGRPFVRLLYRIQREAASRMGEYRNPLLEVRPVRKRAVVVVGSDKGLCGALNSNLFRLVAQFDPGTTVFVAAGRRVAQFIARTRRQLAAEFTYGETPRFAEASAIASFARDLFLKGEVDEVRVIGTRFINTLTQVPLCLEFLPIGQITSLDVLGGDVEKELVADKSECLFEPGPDDVLGFFFSRYVNIYMYQVLLNAKASEHSARMVSMKNATDSADGLIQDLTLEYNKLRQGNITKELLDLAGGEAA
jgi:F-type H+-transporting ATPase subunit gamma